jgi:hypothetical protein
MIYDLDQDLVERRKAFYAWFLYTDPMILL